MTIQPQLIYVWIDQSIITDENVQISSHFDALHNLFTNKQRRIFNTVKDFKKTRGRIVGLTRILIIERNLSSIKLPQCKILSKN